MRSLIPSRTRVLGSGFARRAATLAVAAACVLTFAPTPGNAQVYVRVAPPAPIVEPPPPPPPGARYVWVPGHWHWTGSRYVWRSGHYVARPPRYSAWVPAHYTRTANGWYYVPGHWR